MSDNSVYLSRLEALDVDGIVTGWSAVFVLDTGREKVEVPVWIEPSVHEKDLVQTAGLRLHQMLRGWQEAAQTRWTAR